MCRVETMQVSEGWLARSPVLRLAAVGKSEDEASTKLRCLIALYERVLSR